jgi:hypothetical protein
MHGFTEAISKGFGAWQALGTRDKSLPKIEIGIRVSVVAHGMFVSRVLIHNIHGGIKAVSPCNEEACVEASNQAVLGEDQAKGLIGHFQKSFGAKPEVTHPSTPISIRQRHIVNQSAFEMTHKVANEGRVSVGRRGRRLQQHVGVKNLPFYMHCKNPMPPLCPTYFLRVPETSYPTYCCTGTPRTRVKGLGGQFHIAIWVHQAEVTHFWELRFVNPHENCGVDGLPLLFQPEGKRAGILPTAP